MIQFLASVSGPEEALVALGGGADIIDLKNPADGSLGAVAPDAIQRTIAAIGGRRPVSAVAGNLPMEVEAVVGAVEARCEADFVKIGLFPADIDATRDVIEAVGRLSEKTLLIAVLFADQEPNTDLLETLAEAAFHGVMLDTLDKSGGGLTRHMGSSKLQAFVQKARAFNLMVGLAGSLEAPDIQRLSVLKPDYLGFRSAMTSGIRHGAIDEDRVREIAGLIKGRTPPSVRPSTDVRGVGDEASIGSPIEGDRVFVNDFTLPLEIGAYAHEYGRTQEVRFSVEALVAPIPSDARTMAHIYSYDIIIDAVRALVERGHTVLVEELATGLADTLLADDRVREIKVRVEKLGLGPGAVGVEILRRSREHR